MVLKTLFYSLFLISTSGLLISIYVLVRVRQYGGALQWTLGILNLMLAAILIGLREQVPDVFSFHLANILFISVPALISHSLRRFVNDDSFPWPEYITAFLFSLLFVLALEFSSVEHRIILISLAYGVLWLFPAWQISFSAGGRRYGDHLLAVIFLIVSLLSFARSLLTTEIQAPRGFLDLGGFHLVYLFVGTALWFGALTGYILLVNGRLALELRAETALLKEAIDTRDKFFGIIAHDLRDSAGTVLNAVEMLEHDISRIPSPPDTLTNLSFMTVRQARLLNEILENLLTWARLRQNKITYENEEILLMPLLKGEVDIHKSRAAEKNISIEIASEVPEPAIIGDLHSIRALFRNLLSNGVKYSRPGEDIRILVKAGPAAERMTIEVVDRGVGIPPERLKDIHTGKKIVSAPGTRNERGTGLGLQLCNDYVQGNGGTLSFTSTPGNGTRVAVELRAAPA